MFSFKLNKERFVSPHTYIKTQEEREEEERQEEEEENVQAMDTNPVENVPFSPFVFPPSCYQVVIQSPQHFYWKRELIPVTLLPLSPNVMQGLEGIDNLTGLQKSISAVYTALPIPVHTSPLVALFLDNVPKDCKQRPVKQRYINWTQSVFQLRCFIPLILEFAIPFHSSVSNEYPHECFQEFLDQTRYYEELHTERIERLFSEETIGLGSVLQLFVDYCIDFSYYYIHSLERFIFKVLVEPHILNNNQLQNQVSLEHILTPVDTTLHVSACENKASMLKCILDFFELKVLATQKRDQRHAGDDYVFRNPIQINLIEQRIKTAPPDQLVMGCVDSITMKEYLQFCDPNNNLKNL